MYEAERHKYFDQKITSSILHSVRYYIKNFAFSLKAEQINVNNRKDQFYIRYDNIKLLSTMPELCILLIKNKLIVRSVINKKRA